MFFADNGKGVTMSRKLLGLLAVLALGLGWSSMARAALYWTPWVSEEGGSPASICTAWNEAAVGFSCRGNYCDDVRLLCETLPFGATLDASTDYWTSYFSEEDSGVGTWQSAGWYPWSGD